MHFTIAVRDKHIRDMVCPICGEPDINDQEQLDSYFSTLDIQVQRERDGEPEALIGCFVEMKTVPFKISAVDED